MSVGASSGVATSNGSTTSGVSPSGVPTGTLGLCFASRGLLRLRKEALGRCTEEGLKAAHGPPRIVRRRGRLGAHAGVRLGRRL
eukprot:4481598-Alexandrium_andersonii.AAC.1